jgi:general secretion pathway protein L
METIAEFRAATVDMMQRAMSWWLGELAGLMPRRFARRLENAPAILEVSAGQATLLLADNGAPALRVKLGGADAAEDRARVQVATGGTAARRVVIRLDPSMILEAEVTLPRNAERALRQILVHQLDRLVPLPADAVAFDYVVIEDATTDKTLDVKLIVATRESIDRAVALVRSVGLDPEVVIAPSGVAGDSATVTLWQAHADQMASPAQLWLRRGLAVAAVGLFVTAYSSYVWRLGAYRDDLQQQVLQATKASAVARDLVNQNAQTEGALALLVQRRQQEMDPLMLLDELTKLVPDTMWISQLAVRGRNVELIGYAPRVADLISRIQNSDIFYDPKFRSAITMAPDGERERFDVSFDAVVKDGQ